MPPPGHGSVPLLPTPVGPGVPPPHMDGPHRDPRGPPGFSEQSPMYDGPPNSMGRSLPPQSHPHDPHMPSRHRRNGSGSHTNSPAMSSLQRPPPYDDRERERDRDGGRGLYVGPPSHLSGGIGPGHGATTPVGRGDHRSTSSMSTGRGPPQPTLIGPGAAGESINFKDQERERDRERGRERERENRMMERREREMRDREMREREMREREMRERDMRERDMREREIMRERDIVHKKWEEDKMRERREREREIRESRDLMAGLHPSDRQSGPEREGLREREREHQRKIVAKDPPEGIPVYMSPHPTEPRRQAELEEHGVVDDRRGRMGMGRMEEMNWHVQPERSVGHERDVRGRERVPSEIDRSLRKDRREPRRVPDDGWLPDPRNSEPWPKDMERDQLRERERLSREMREREDIDLRRGHPHYRRVHIHHPHRLPQSQGLPTAPLHAANSKSSKSSRLPDPSELIPVPGSATLPAPFGSGIPERPQHVGHKHLPLKTPIGSSTGQPSLVQHLHPSQSMHHGPPPTIGFYPPTPPPMNALTPSVPSKSPRPPLLPSLPPRHLGAFVYPRVPFPFLDFSSPFPDPGSASTSSGTISEREIREIHATIYIPTGFLPTVRPKHPRIWGGAPIPSFNPLFAAPQLIHHLQSGMSYGFPRPHPYEVQGTRRVYTDDSDLFLCALHAGLVSWSATRQACKESKDLRIEIRLTKEPRYVGGLGAKYVGAPEGQAGLGDDDGSSLLSSGWGNGHDGAGMEILSALFVKVCTVPDKVFTHSHTRFNRRAPLTNFPRLIVGNDW